MYIIRPPPILTRLAKDWARATVASKQARAIRASNFKTMGFMLVRFSPSIHSLDVRQLPQITPGIFHWAAHRNFDANQLWTRRSKQSGGSSDVGFGSLGGLAAGSAPGPLCP